MNMVSPTRNSATQSTLIHLAVVGAMLFVIALVTNQSGSDGRLSAEEPPANSVEYWVSQLGHEHYLRRETASKKLVAAGPDAIPLLADAVRGGDLEVVERATKAIVEISIGRAPRDDGGAYERLNTLASQSVGRSASIARGAVQEIRTNRHSQARQALAAAGIAVGMKEFVIGAISQPKMLVQVDDAWNGDREALQWLAWLSGVDTARVSGRAVTPEVMEFIAQVPGLRSLAIVEGQIADEVLEPLTRMDRIENLDLRYVQLTDRQGDLIAAIPLRVSLNLMGTGISPEKVQSMRQALPGLQIDHRKGGFLGVTCIDNTDACEIHTIVENGAAEEAGLIKGDVIVQIGEAKVQHFKDLQDAINEQLPGDEIDVLYRRGDKIQSVKVRLRRFEES
jgi:hypothetical protein